MTDELARITLVTPPAEIGGGTDVLDICQFFDCNRDLSAEDLRLIFEKWAYGDWAPLGGGAAPLFFCRLYQPGDENESFAHLYGEG